MAKKQTLKSLLGGSDDRVQVSYDPSEITLSPTVQQTKGSSTVVQAMPQTNQALNFARALNQVPQVMGQMKNIGQAQALEDFNQITDNDKKDRLLSGEEEMKRNLMLGYDKSFQEELVKDYFVRNAADITKRFTSIADNHTEEKKFKEAMAAEKQSFIGELTEQFGNNPNRVVAINAFGDKIVTEIEGQTNEIFSENIRLGAVGLKATNLKTFIKGGGDIDIGITTFLNETQGEQLLTKSESKAELLINGMAIANQFAKDGQYDKALEITEKLKSREFFKGATYAGDDLNKIVNLEDGIRNAKNNNDSVSTSNVAQQIRNSFSFISTQLAGVGKGENVGDTTYNQVIGLIEELRPNLPTEEKLKLMSKFDDESLTDKQKVEMLKTILTEAGTLEFKGEDGEIIGVPDNTSTIFNLASQGFVDYYAQEAVLNPWLVNGLTDEQKERASVGALDAFKLRNIRPEGWMREIGYPGATPPQSVLDAYKEANKLNWMKTNKTFANFNEGSLKVTLKNEFTNLRFFSNSKTKEASSKWSAFVDEYSDSYYPMIAQDLEDYASTIIDDENREELLTNKVSELKNYYANNLGQMFEAKTNFTDYLQYGLGRDANSARTGVQPSEFNFMSDDKTKREYGIGDAKKLDPITSSEKFVEESIKGENNIKKYPHLQFLQRRLFAEKYAYKNVEEFQSIYKDMRDNKDRNALQATMVAYGYPTYTPEAAEDLRKTGLSFAEVRLFGNIDELTEISIAWQNAYNKATLGETLNAEEQKAFDTLTDFGIFNSETFGQFMNVQQDLVEKY